MEDNDKSCGNCLYSDDFYNCPDKHTSNYCPSWKDEGFPYTTTGTSTKPKVKTGKDSQGLYIRVEMSSIEPVKSFVAIIPELLADERIDHGVRMEYKGRFIQALKEMGCDDELGAT